MITGTTLTYLTHLISMVIDEEMIWQNNNTDLRRIVVRKFELWVPQLHFTGKGQTLANENFLKPTQWKYLNENLHISSSQRGANGTWMSLYLFSKQGNKMLTHRRTLTFLTHLISMVMTQQDWTLAA